MKSGVLVGVVVGVAVLGIAGLALASTSAAPLFSAGLRPPLQVGQVVMVTYALPHGMSTQQGAALLSFVMQWGTPLAPPQVGVMRDGTGTLSIVARVEVAQPNGPPAIPSPLGNLEPIAWQETAVVARASA